MKHLIQHKNTIPYFAKKNNNDWGSIFNAKNASDQVRQDISSLLKPKGIPLLSTSDVDLVVFGSIARNEFTISSDIDWTLLVDGQADSTHYKLSRDIKGILEENKFIEPGPTGMFGQTSFSHELIHHIGGEDDTNHNITRRILLL